MRVRLCATLLSAGLLLPVAASAQDAGDNATTPPATADDSTVAAQPVDAPQPALSTAPAADASPAAAPGMIGPAPADKAQIVFFRPSKFTGGAIGFKVREGEQELGKLRSGNYFIHLAEPGTHEYTVHSEAKDVLSLEVEEGETYYVQGTITMGVFAGRPNLSPSDVATFDGMADKLKLRE
ncbi:DUF2846 domain-containing protein [Stenotrophomonas sp. SY1]|uniref:DUF2846 domain-containing protein n=1 Tax=Stenotrophomonas sp. SY1 TaxID=477235 RepID=UPI001E51D0CC|nr:DUF2846 domain-containing protein [Stenotrophomonas sp. SY1]MCD9088063.1 DUF2846 domain-containing protein [Stenotrophomonas sp. SY1]